MFCLKKGYFKLDDKLAVYKVAGAISKTMQLGGFKNKNSIVSERPIIVMCIGTDRSTGDSLGPLVGDMLRKYKTPSVHIYGTLESPVHARNLEETLSKALSLHSDAYIVAVDASLGTVDHVGCISVGVGPIKPGAGLKKDLPPVGNMHITGVVNNGGFMDFLVLQSTRLSVVMKMADIISRSIHMVFNEYSSFIIQDKCNTL